MEPQLLLNQIRTDISELEKDVNAGMYDDLSSLSFWYEEVKRIIDKMRKFVRAYE